MSCHVPWAKRFREMRRDDDPSFLTYVMEEDRKKGVPHVHGPDCKHDR